MRSVLAALLDVNTLNGAALIRRQAALAVGGFDESMREGCEDVRRVRFAPTNGCIACRACRCRRSRATRSRRGFYHRHNRLARGGSCLDDAVVCNPRDVLFGC